VSLQNCWQVPGLCLLLTDTTSNSTCQTSLTSPHNTRRTGCSMSLQPGKGLRGNKLTLKASKLSPFYSQFQADQVDGYRTSRIVFSLNLISRCPIPWARLSPQSTGTKDAISSAKDALCNHSRGSSPSLAFSTATMCYIPSVTQNLQMSLSKLLPSDRSISVKFSTMESP